MTSNDQKPLFSFKHPQRTPFWKRIWHWFRRPKLSEEGLEEVADITPEEVDAHFMRYGVCQKCGATMKGLRVLHTRDDGGFFIHYTNL